ncbi:phosphonate C-P lyase system protein PhnG [Slackia faecicanis]|uniref:Phosphonate C-P lyase system protein PhnG n=1 Tax=Slackia faecicanis TaxID=255723 RepID=A0A3N0AHY5_9ACTN|nr:phosphonate C-P lyase system protein PhnG [Slackia faecicanis]RNL21391.1 phosphonate C-P lyase system protein PhnG [Slackia faecicanis]
MRRRERTRILVKGDPGLARRIAADIEAAAHVDIVEAPREELVMVKVRESARRSLFYLGEALMTTCRVSVEGVSGKGMVLGSDREAAYALAVVDAAYAAPEGRFDTDAYDRMLAEQAQAIEAAASFERRAVAATKVDFSTMEDEL